MLVAAALIGVAAPAGNAAPNAAPLAGPVVSAKVDGQMMASLCPGGKGPGNLVLVVTVRGSGDSHRGGKLSRQYHPALARELAARGYWVNGVDITYPAVGTDLLRKGQVLRFIDSAAGHGPSIARQIETLIARCRTRHIVIAAYSQGGIALRSALMGQLWRTRPKVLARIRHIDLIADASAARRLDIGMPVGRTPETRGIARRNSEGAWDIALWVSKNRNSASAKALLRLLQASGRAGDFNRIPDLGGGLAYPSGFKGRIDRYCAYMDLVCDTRTVMNDLLRLQCLSEGCLRSKLSYSLGQHTGRYPWRSIALDTAGLFARNPRSPGPIAPPDPGSVPPAAGTVPNPPSGDPSGALRGETLSAGDFHACALRSGGAISCWGLNDYGQVGDGSTVTRLTPVLVAGIGDAVQISAGREHTCALRSGGTISCWGQNDGQLGDGTRVTRLTPVPVVGISDAVQISAAGNHTCALRSGGTISCWGVNSGGKLGDGTTIDRLAPTTTVVGIADAIEISAGEIHVCALRSGGTISCWGANVQGQLGDGSFTTAPTPVSVAGIGDATQISSGGGHTCAVRSGGTISCWGGNAFGELGDGTYTVQPTPVSVAGIANAVQVSAGDVHVCALRSGGPISCWGYNYYGQLGDGTTTERPTPVSVAGIADATQVSAGFFHTCTLRSGGTISCWGRNVQGEVGDGTTDSRLTPVPVLGFP